MTKARLLTRTEPPGRAAKFLELVAAEPEMAFNIQTFLVVDGTVV
jgi:hypothetical protein